MGKKFEEVINSMFGFNQKAASSITENVLDRNGKKKVLKIDYIDLAILRYLAAVFVKKQMNSIEFEGTNYSQILYRKLLEDLPLLDCNKKTVGERLKKLVQLKVLNNYFNIQDNGLKPFYAPGERFMEIID